MWDSSNYATHGTESFDSLCIILTFAATHMDSEMSNFGLLLGARTVGQFMHQQTHQFLARPQRSHRKSQYL